MANITLPLNLGHQPSRHLPMSNAQLVNLYLTNKSLAPTPGLEEIKTIINPSKIRGTLNSSVYGGIIYVSGSDIYLIRGQTRDRIGFDIIPNDDEVKLVENFDSQIAILTLNEIYILDKSASNTVKKLTSLGEQVQDVAYQDTYFIYAIKDKNQFKISENNNGLKIYEDFTGIIGGKVTAIESFEQQLWVFSNDDINIFYDSGQRPNVYQKTKTLAVNYGLGNRTSISQNFGLMCWLSTSKSSSPFITVTDGSYPKIISNENIDYIINNCSNPLNSRGLLYQLDGHIFYMIYFDDDNFGFIYDFETKIFSKVTFKNPIISLNEMNGVCYAGIKNNGSFFKFDLSITTDADSVVNRYIIFPTLIYKNRIAVNNLDMYIETGYAKGSCELNISRDKGITFQNVETKNLLNGFGDFLAFRQLGSAYYWTIMLRFFIDGKFSFNQVELTV